VSRCSGSNGVKPPHKAAYEPMMCQVAQRAGGRKRWNAALQPGYVCLNARCNDKPAVELRQHGTSQGWHPSGSNFLAHSPHKILHESSTA
jgi:hypothetical protein